MDFLGCENGRAAAGREGKRPQSGPQRVMGAVAAHPGGQRLLLGWALTGAVRAPTPQFAARGAP